MVDQGNASGPAKGIVGRQTHDDPASVIDGRSLAKTAAILADRGPPVDYLKLARIRTALARGDYRINTRAIADAIALQAHI